MTIAQYTGVMAQHEIMAGLIADDDVADGWVYVSDDDEWFMSRDQWLRLQELRVMGEVALFLDLLGPGLHQLPDEYVA